MGIMSWSGSQGVEEEPKKQEVKAIPKQKGVESKQQKIKVTSKQGGVCGYCGGRGWTDFGKCDICRGSGRVSRK